MNSFVFIFNDFHRMTSQKAILMINLVCSKHRSEIQIDFLYTEYCRSHLKNHSTQWKQVFLCGKYIK